MKKIILLIVFTAFMSCETKTVEVAKPAGEWLIGSLKGDKFIPGPEEDAQVAMDVIMGYAEKDFELMMERSADTVMFFPEKGGEIIQLVKPFDDFVKSLQEPYDSIVRTPYNVYPIRPESSDNFTIVTVPFTELRYAKDGSVEKERIIERFWVVDGKVVRVNKWAAELN